MKRFLWCWVLFCLVAMPLCADAQTGSDISEIKDEISTIKIDVATLKTDVAVLTSEVKNLKESVNTRFDSIEKGFDRQNNIIIACIGIPLAIIAIGVTIWGILAHRRSVREKEHQQEIETLKQELKEEFKREVEALKNQQVVSS